MVEVIQWMLTGIWSDSRVGTFSLVEPEWRMFIPVAGGLVAGCILLFLKKRMPGQATEYMEAMSIGNGLIKFRASALKVFPRHGASLPARPSARKGLSSSLPP